MIIRAILSCPHFDLCRERSAVVLVANDMDAPNSAPATAERRSKPLSSSGPGRTSSMALGCLGFDIATSQSISLDPVESKFLD